MEKERINKLTEEEVNILFTDNIGLVKLWCYQRPRYADIYGDMDDFVQEMSMAVLKQLPRYDKSLASISTFMYQMMAYACKRKLERYYRIKESTTKNYGHHLQEVPMSKFNTDTGFANKVVNYMDNAVDPSTVKEDTTKELYERVHNFIMNNASQYYIDKYINEEKVVSIAARNNCTHQYIDQELNKEQKRWRPFLEALKEVDFSKAKIKKYKISNECTMFLEDEVFNNLSTIHKDCMVMRRIDFAEKHHVTQVNMRKEIISMMEEIDFRYTNNITKYFK